ncbi:hypothetical protein ACIQUB_29745 [Rhizobium sp. NPDC090275]
MGFEAKVGLVLKRRRRVRLPSYMPSFDNKLFLSKGCRPPRDRHQ